MSLGVAVQITHFASVAAFQPVEQVKARVDSISREIQQSRPVAATTRLYPPGLLEAQLENANARDGIPLNEATILGIRTAARNLVAQVIQNEG